MSQVDFKDGEFRGILYFVLEREFGEEDGDTEISFTDYKYMDECLKNYYEGNYEELFNMKDITDAEFKGIEFSGRQGSEKFSVNIEDGWKRATFSFDEAKFGDLNIDKMKRIRDIIKE